MRFYEMRALKGDQRENSWCNKEDTWKSGPHTSVGEEIESPSILGTANSWSLGNLFNALS